MAELLIIGASRGIGLETVSAALRAGQMCRMWPYRLLRHLTKSARIETQRHEWPSSYYKFPSRARNGTTTIAQARFLQDLAFPPPHSHPEVLMGQRAPAYLVEFRVFEVGHRSGYAPTPKARMAWVTR